MAITQDDIKKIAQLARLRLSEADSLRYTSNLDNILKLVDTMNAINTEGIAPMSHPFDAVARERDDLVTEPNMCEALMAIAPESEMGLYLVPQVIE
jgi:aspartyl-tRNA(Asn)/glutamyl-tRNA(Gln) amidotransferase subunit C